MKKLLALTLALMALTVFVSCGEDDPTFGDNEIVIGEETMPLVPNYYYDNNADLTNGLPRRTDGIVIVEPISTHIRRFVRLQDTPTNNYGSVELEFYSKGETFKNGTYVVKSYDDEVDADTESFVTIYVSANEEVYGFYEFEGVSGVVTISGDEAEVDLNGITLKFNLSGMAYVPVILERQNGSSDVVTLNVKGQFKGEIPLD